MLYTYWLVFSVVVGNILAQRSDQDHTQDAGQEEDDDKRVYD